MKTQTPQARKDRHDFLIAMRNGIVLGAVILAVALPMMRANKAPTQPIPAATAPTAVATPPAPAAIETGRLADFGAEEASAEVRHVANWAFFTGNYEGKSVVVVDKKGAKVYAFDPSGKLLSSTPALLGAAIGDHTVPGVGDKPLSAVLPEEKTTPAGRFIAEPGVNTKGEDIVWVDYNAAVSMHRVRPLVAAERRLERLASSTVEDNRISFGCINLPVAFYEGVLSPTVKKTGAVIYVLPETRTPQELFGSYDVAAPQTLHAAVAQPGREIAPADAATRQARRNRDSVQ